MTQTDLTEVQQKAADWNEGALMLLAGPGSGKTRVLTTRTARLLLEDAAARWRILALTFTTRAADEMRQRVELLVPNSGGRLLVGTFHSFAMEVLRQSGSHVGVKTDFQIYSNSADRLRLLERALKEEGIDLGEPLSRAFPVIDGLRDRLAGPDESLRFFSDQDRGERFCAAYGAYDRYLSKENALDFPGIIFKAHRLFRDYPAIAERYRRTYRYMSIDEFQDTNLAQYEFVRAFTGEAYKNVFVVADDDQVIYQWNGASPKRLQQFVENYDPSVLQMPTNFRCPAEVVEMANRLVANNLLRTPGKRPLVAGKAQPTQDGRVRLLTFASDGDEYAGVAADVATNRAGELGKTAIIARTKALLEGTQLALASAGVDSQIAQRRDNFASTPYQWLHASLQSANRRSDEQQFATFVEAGNALWGLELDVGQLVAQALSDNGDFLRAWSRSAVGAAPQIEGGVEVIKSLAVNLAERNDFHKFIRSAVSIFDAMPAVEEDASLEEDARAWKDLYREINSTLGRDAPLDTFLQELSLRSKEPPLRDDVVALLTIHGSKGNEFDHVYLVGLAEDVLPSFQSKKSGDRSPQLEEERRNCFVAITRCMETLTLTRANSYRGWGKQPSRFLAEMGL